MPNTPSLKAKVRGIDKILKALPEIKERLSKDNSWESIKSLCQPLGLTDTAFRDNPRVNDYLLSEKYWQDRLKKLLPKGKPQSPQPVWEKRFYRKWNKGDFLETDKFLIAMSDNRVLVNDEKIVAFIRQLLTSQNSTLREKIEGMDKDLPAGDEIYGLSDRKRGAIEGYNKALADVEDILNSL